MTVGGIILCGFFTIIILGIGLLCAYASFDNANIIGGVCSIVIAIIICAGFWVGANWYYKETESGKRAIKTQESNFDGGIIREVKVYDVEGDLIQEYKGKFDVEYDDDRILFDDENGNRHIIYYPTGTVVIDEVKE